MGNGAAETSLARAERALERITAALERESAQRRRDERLREGVREAIAELDRLIHGAVG